MGRTWVLALVCATCARGSSAGGGSTAAFALSDPDELSPRLRHEDGVIGATIEFLDVTYAGKPAAGQVVDVQNIAQ